MEESLDRPITPENRKKTGGPDPADISLKRPWTFLPFISGLVGTALLFPLMQHLSFLGHDWRFGFVQHDLDAVFPPWIILLLNPLIDLPVEVSVRILQCLTLSFLAVITLREGRDAFPHKPKAAAVGVLLVLLTPLPWVMLWLGQVEVLNLIGMSLMPIGVILLAAKPHFGFFVALANRRYILALALVIVVSVVIWGMWPIDLLRQASTERILHPTAMGWRSLTPLVGVAGVLLLSITDRDPWRLMAAGSFISPYVMPYHYYLLLPALGRVSGPRRIVLWLAFFLPLLATGFRTPASKYLCLLLPLGVWAFLAPSLRLQDIRADSSIILNRLIDTAREIWGVFRKATGGA